LVGHFLACAKKFYREEDTVYNLVERHILKVVNKNAQISSSFHPLGIQKKLSVATKNVVANLLLIKPLGEDPLK